VKITILKYTLVAHFAHIYIIINIEYNYFVMRKDCFVKVY